MSNSVSRQTTNHVPEAVVPIAELMSAFRAPWALCGGWAVDAWLGGQTRDHGDVDISVFIQDQRALFEHMAGWQMIAHDPHVPDDTSAPWDGRPLGLPGHLHCRLDAGERLPEDGIALPSDGFILDIQLNDRARGDWVLHREPLISLAMRKAVRESSWGLPTVVPEVLLFFKASELRRRDKLDFLALLPGLTRNQRDWLRSAIALVGHPWMSQLSP